MKKVIIFLLAILLVSSFLSCTGKEDEGKNTDSVTSVASTSEETLPSAETTGGDLTSSSSDSGKENPKPTTETEGSVGSSETTATPNTGSDVTTNGEETTSKQSSEVGTPTTDDDEGWGELHPLS